MWDAAVPVHRNPPALPSIFSLPIDPSALIEEEKERDGTNQKASPLPRYYALSNMWRIYTLPSEEHNPSAIEHGFATLEDFSRIWCLHPYDGSLDCGVVMQLAFLPKWTPCMGDTLKQHPCSTPRLQDACHGSFFLTHLSQSSRVAAFRTVYFLQLVLHIVGDVTFPEQLGIGSVLALCCVGDSLRIFVDGVACERASIAKGKQFLETLIHSVRADIGDTEPPRGKIAPSTRKAKRKVLLGLQAAPEPIEDDGTHTVTTVEYLYTHTPATTPREEEMEEAEVENLMEGQKPSPCDTAVNPVGTASAPIAPPEALSAPHAGEVAVNPQRTKASKRGSGSSTTPVLKPIEMEDLPRNPVSACLSDAVVVGSDALRRTPRKQRQATATTPAKTPPKGKPILTDEFIAHETRPKAQRSSTGTAATAAISIAVHSNESATSVVLASVAKKENTAREALPVKSDTRTILPDAISGIKSTKRTDEKAKKRNTAIGTTKQKPVGTTSPLESHGNPLVTLPRARCIQSMLRTCTRLRRRFPAIKWFMYFLPVLLALMVLALLVYAAV